MDNEQYQKRTSKLSLNEQLSINEQDQNSDTPWYHKATYTRRNFEYFNKHQMKEHLSSNQFFTNQSLRV